MKQFIVLCAILPILLLIMIQFSLDQINSNKINAVNQAVYAAKERAQQEGYFSDSIEEELMDNLFDIGFDEKDIEINFNDFDCPQAIGTILDYSVSVTIKKALVGFLNSSTYKYIIDSCTVSQYIEIL